MMTVEEMRQRKEELGYTCEMISEKSNVPLSTVQKIFSGVTSKPRYETMLALEPVLSNYVLRPAAPMHIAEEALDYSAAASCGEYGRWPDQGQYTLKDYYAIPDDIRVELIDGVIYDMGAPTKAHQLILGSLYLEISRCISEHGKDCTVFLAPTDVRLDGDDRTMVQPDIIVLCHEDINKRYIEGAPELVVEILSDSTRSKDCILKLNKYMTAGVKEYWIVDPKTLKVIVYNFEVDQLPEQYSFEDKIPVGLSGGTCEIDFAVIKRSAERYL